MSFRQLAVGDDPETRGRAAQHPDRFGAVDRIAVAVAAPAHVDHRDVEVPDVADQMDGLVAGRDLVDDEAVLDCLPDAETDERLAVDHKAVVLLTQGASDLAGGWVGRRRPGGPMEADPNRGPPACGRKSG